MKTRYSKSISEAYASMYEAKMSSSQIARLKKAYEPMRDKRISTANADKLSKMLDMVGKDKEALIQLFKADIPFVSQGAVTKLITKHNMKGAEINKFKEHFTIESVELDEAAGLADKSKKSGISVGILKKVYDRGLAAYKTGHRPGTTAPQWAMARVNSFITKGSGTWGGADKDLAKQAGGKKEEMEEDFFDPITEACWAGYKQVGMKNKGGKEVPNCVPESVSEWVQVDLDEYYEIGTDEYKEYLKNLTPGETNEEKKNCGCNQDPCITYGSQEEGAAADARRAIMKDKDLRRGKDSADDDDDATDDDVKAASKNIMMQLRKSVSLKGRFDVEFGDGKKVKIPPKIAQEVQRKFNAIRRPQEKQKFQAKIAKSHKSMLAALRESYDTSPQKIIDEAILKDRDYEVDEKEGVVKISKKNFAKVRKDAKGTDKSKPTMMVLTKKGTSLYPVKFTEEVDLDEATKQVLAHGGKGKYKVTKDGDKIEIKFGGKVVGTADFDRGADSFFVSMKGEKGQKSFDDAQAIADYFAKNKITEEGELEEGRMKELHGYIEQGKSAEWIAKKMKVDVKTIKQLMNSYIPEHANSKPHHHPHREDDDLKEKKKKPVVFKGTPKQIKQQMKNLKKKDKLNIGEGDAEDRVRDKQKDQSMRDRDSKEKEIERAKVQDFRSAQRDKKSDRERKQRNEVLDRVASKLKERTNG